MPARAFVRTSADSTGRAPAAACDCNRAAIARAVSLLRLGFACERARERATRPGAFVRFDLLDELQMRRPLAAGVAELRRRFEITVAAARRERGDGIIGRGE